MAAYDEIYSIIQSQEGSEAAIANRVFQWIYRAETELHVDFLVQAVCQELFSEKPKLPDFDDQFLLRSCQNLVIIDKKRICRFSHLSVREYLEQQHQGLLSQSHVIIADVCLQFLGRKYGEEVTLKTSSKYAKKMKHKLIEYAEKYWPYHCGIAMEEAKDNRCIEAVMRFLGSMNEVGPAYRRYRQTSKLVYMAKGNMNFKPSLIYWNETLRKGSALIPVCRLGFYQILKQLHEASPDFKQGIVEEDSILYVAVLSGCDNLVQLLLEMGTDVNAQLSGEYGSALAAAAGERNESTVKLLLDNGADVNAQLSGEYGSALAAAAGWGNESIVKLLLDKGADVNAQLSGEYGSALAAAASQRNESTVKLLLKKGAEINLQQSIDYGSTLLRTAVFIGCDSAVEMLLSYRANVELPSAEGYEQGIFYNGLSDVKASTMQLLIESGLEVETGDGLLPSVFATFAMYGEEKNIEKLWTSNMSHIQNLDKHGRNLLHFIVRGGKWKTFEALQHLGLDPMQKDVLGSSILHQAASGGDIQGLIKLPKDYLVELSKSKYWSPLHWACRAGKAEVVEQLLKLGIRGSGVKTLSPERIWSPYSIAVYFGTWESISIAEGIDESRLRLDDEGEESQILPAERQSAFCDGCFNVSLFPEFSFKPLTREADLWA
jgi:ankyrin repeat protein